ncbi:MAG: hypothetical protein HN427_06530 [Flavobacteriales bacterium]|nr:hypothetical protein [Flavobacteriales bacterium]MBT7481723.1 hypothetical protein [Flavobacteriales bacterium]
MKKLILLLITLITLINVSYASFPLSQEIKTEILEISKSENESLSDPFELTGLAIAILIFYLFRASVKTTDPNERKRLRIYAFTLSILLILAFIILSLILHSMSSSWINFFDSL